MGNVTIQVKRQKRQPIEVYIVGLTDLICCAAPKAVKDPAATTARKRKAKTGNLPDEMDSVEVSTGPEKAFQASLYYLPDGTPFGFPSSAVLRSIASAMHRFAPINPRFDKGTPAVVHGSVFMLDEWLTIDAEEGPIMRHDIGRNKRGSLVDVYRGSFKGWRMLVRMELETDVVTPERLINALDMAGRRVGIGAWRPERGGRFGRFQVETA